ncbi:hypothetical protein OIU77_027587 [Salix suchowensis]|uniref:Uncharacterized protein n=1 Tax=Salix suchowensis TaxID=1278906 RepID=A0ABQ9BQK2_9ROSI|nr:hypothetical protein OIU77_027587 [Salix suchowensis]
MHKETKQKEKKEDDVGSGFIFSRGPVLCQGAVSGASVCRPASKAPPWVKSSPVVGPFVLFCFSCCRPKVILLLVRTWWTTIGDPYSSFMAGAMVLQSTGHTPFFSKENEDLDTQKREKGVRPHQPPSLEVERV